MPSSKITDWLSRVVTDRDTPSRTSQRGAGHNSEDEGEDIPSVGAIRLDDRPDNYYLRSSYPDSEDDGIPHSMPSRETSSSPGLIFTPSSSSRASTNNSQVNLEEQRRLGRRFEKQAQTTRELSQGSEPSIHEERLLREEAERALQAALIELEAIHKIVGDIADHTTLIVQTVKRVGEEPTKENVEAAVSEAQSVGERLAELHASIWDAIPDEKRTKPLLLPCSSQVAKARQMSQ
ncbi:hypothetical protein CEP54_001108 [Fusarium duplospermum]|uniref:Uncharacterized protein n=1 Tax=Fusarium duplospermum TaxID=1325734 RepID=A0A428R2Y7_9HYPO|nr:hypothetical protein CEP54_001108 [Fusarium duplospermum]